MNLAIEWRALDDIEWNSGVLVDGLNGNLAIKTPEGYVTMDRNGTTRISPNMSNWEGNYILDKNNPVLRITPNIVTYVVEIREV